MESQHCLAQRWLEPLGTVLALFLGVSVLALCRHELKLDEQCIPAASPADLSAPSSSVSSSVSSSFLSLSSSSSFSSSSSSSSPSYSTVSRSETLCAVGNVAGLCSSVLWFAVLVPQVVHNSVRRSVEGLSFAWSVSNLVASVINLFFVLHHKMPIYIYISALYMPILEVVILWQFACYGAGRRRAVLFVTTLCIAYATANVLFWEALTEIVDLSEWLAMVLWGIETIFQLWINHDRGSVDGQAAYSVGIAWLGKSTDYTAMYLLALPLQNVLLTFFSTSTAYANVFQFFLLSRAMTPLARTAGLCTSAAMFLLCSVLLGTKLAWFWGFLGPSCLALVTFGGYRVNRALFPVTASSGPSCSSSAL